MQSRRPQTREVTRCGTHGNQGGSGRPVLFVWLNAVPSSPFNTWHGGEYQTRLPGVWQHHEPKRDTESTTCELDCSVCVESDDVFCWASNTGWSGKMHTGGFVISSERDVT